MHGIECMYVCMYVCMCKRLKNYLAWLPVCRSQEHRDLGGNGDRNGSKKTPEQELLRIFFIGIRTIICHNLYAERLY